MAKRKDDHVDKMAKWQDCKLFDLEDIVNCFILKMHIIVWMSSIRILLMLCLSLSNREYCCLTANCGGGRGKAMTITI